MISIYLGDSKIFHIETYAVTGDGVSTVSATPVSGYFSLIRINDQSAIIDHVNNISISGNHVFYELTPAVNVDAGLCVYVFDVYFSSGYKETYTSFVEIKAVGV